MAVNENILEMRGISKSFPGVHALKKVNLSIQRGEVHCLIGANGAGKSTLMKILAGAYSRDEGEIIFDGKAVSIASPLEGRKLGIAVIYQELSLAANLSAAENIFLGSLIKKGRGMVDWRAVNRKAREIIDDLGIDIDVRQPVNRLSMGQRQIVELAKALVSEARLIVMDEPSSTLSGEEFETLVRVIKDLKARGITVIYISHRLEELFRVGDRVTVLRDGSYIGTRQLSDISQEQLVEMIIGHSLTRHKKEASGISGEEVLAVKDVVSAKLRSVSLSVHRGEILGLYGLVGSGRTELLRVIYGADPPRGGEVMVRGQKVRLRSPVDALKLGIGMVPENRKTQGLILDLPVWENAAIASIKNFTRLGVIKYGSLLAEVKAQVAKLRVATPSVKTLVKNLSGGNQQKVVIAKWLIKKSNILLFDEPTQGIDIGAKEEVYGIIKDLAGKGLVVVVASSELAELMQICDRIVVMFNGAVAGEYTREAFQEESILHCAVTGR
ncbi:MAG: sugar ABC transporter ATP-binding protein [Bacillota bacterium]